MWPDAIRSAAACALWATGILLKSVYMLYKWLYRSFRMLLACSPAHQLCQAVEAVETVEAVERCDFGAGDALRNALGDKGLSREPHMLYRWL